MRYALKKVRNIVGRDIATGKNKFVLSDLKSLTITGNAEVVWADGADGAHLVGFDTNKVASITAENGSIDIGYLETQTGGSLRKVENGNDVLVTEVLTVKDGKATTTHKASGVVALPTLTVKTSVNNTSLPFSTFLREPPVCVSK